jgi:ACS family hexuronate transporter-like MFS transporter
MSPSADATMHEGMPRFGYRWTILALLFAATTINYVDRQVLGILAPTLQHDLHWTETDYAAIVSWFSLAYGFGALVMGRVMDRIGTRRGFSFSIVMWSLAAMGHALVRTVGGFSLMRAMLGLGESGNFPGSVKTVAEWFPQKERALAIGIFNAGSNVGAVIAPLVVPWITLTWGWQWAFIITGGLGMLWLGFWLAAYHRPEEHPRLSREEFAYIRSDHDPDDATTTVPWRKLLRARQTWAFVAGKAMTDPVWWFYLFWLPKFLDERWHVQLAGLAAPLIAVYIMADAGSIAGGWVSSTLIRRGATVNRARKTALLIAALIIVPTIFAPQAKHMWLAVLIVAVAASAHQWWSANLYTTVGDMFPRRAVASVVGIGYVFSSITSVAFQRATGYVLQASGSNYQLIFLFCGLIYVAAFLVIHLIVPRMTPAQVA